LTCHSAQRRGREEPRSTAEASDGRMSQGRAESRCRCG
jgi:hypothetical protein